MATRKFPLSVKLQEGQAAKAQLRCPTLLLQTTQSCGRAATRSRRARRTESSSIETSRVSVQAECDWVRRG